MIQITSQIQKLTPITIKIIHKHQITRKRK